MTRQNDGRLKAEFRLWDVNTAQQLAGQAIFHVAGILAADRAHHFPTQIYERLTGEKAISTAAWCSSMKPDRRSGRVKRLALMDQDGANVRYLTKGADLVLTPRFSPSTQEITYQGIRAGAPRVYLFNIETGQREIVGNFPACRSRRVSSRTASA